MRHCTKCGKQVRDSWKFCLSCGAEVPAESAPPAESPYTPGEQQAVLEKYGVRRPAADAGAVRNDGIAPPPVLRPPDPSGAPAGGYQLEIPRYQGGQAAAARPGVRPAILIAVLAAVGLLGAVLFVMFGHGSSAGSSGGQSSAAPAQVAAPPTVPATPAEPVGAVDRALAEAERQLGQARTDLERELREEWAAANTEPDPNAGRPQQPDQSVLRDRLRDVRQTIYACASGRTVSVNAKLTLEGATGRVTAATVEGDLPAEARQCIGEVLRGMSVPPFTDGSADVHVPINITSE